MIRFDDMKTEKVALTAEPTRAEKSDKAPRVTLAAKLVELIPNVGDSTFIADGKKTNVDQNIRTAKNNGKLAGKFKTVEYGIGGDSIHPDKAGVRIWRVEAGASNVAHLQAAE